MNNSEKEKLREYILDILKKSEPVSVGDIDIGNAVLVLAYIPLKSEVDITPFIDKCLEKGLEVAVPTENPSVFAVLDYNWRNRLSVLQNRTETVLSDRYINISCIEKNTVVLVPGLMFTKCGKRLGRGLGFYDRVLSAVENNPYVRTIGVCKKNQLAEDLPTDNNDKKVSEISVY